MTIWSEQWRKWSTSFSDPRVGVRDPGSGIRGDEIMETYRDLEVWQVGMDLMVEVYRLTKTLPKEELYALSSQLKRASLSIPSNIAEGWGRKHRKEYLHHLSFAYGSLMEVETQLIACNRLEYLTKDQIRVAWQLCSRVGQMLNKLRQSLD